MTTIPNYALADVDKTSRSQATKSVIRNHIIETARAGKSKLETEDTVDWYVDGMLAVNSVVRKDSWGNFSDAVFSYCTPKENVKIRRLSIIFDSYGESSIKQMTQRKRGSSQKRVYLTNLKQTMPQGKLWNSFLKNPENKRNLIEIMVERFSSKVRSKLEFELLVTHEEKRF